MTKNTCKKIGILTAFALLLAQLFPIHMHIHNHFHKNTNSHVATEIQLTNFESDQIDHHSHATVIDLNDNLLVKNSTQNNDVDFVILFALALIFFFLVVQLACFVRRSNSDSNPPANHFHLRPLLRAPPVFFA